MRYLELGETSVLRHQEHAPITLPAGTYQVIRQREWTDAAGDEEEERARYVGD